MKEVKIYATTFVLALIVSILFTFIWSLGEKSGISFTGVRNNSPDPIELKMLTSCILGGAHGAIVGILSIAYLTILLVVYRELRIPLSTVFIFSSVVGSLFFLFYFQLISGQYSTYSLALSERWFEWLLGFVFDFFTAFIPILLVKRYYEI